MHDEEAAAVQHLVQVRHPERLLPHTQGYYGIQHTVWLVAKGRKQSGRALTILPSFERM